MKTNNSLYLITLAIVCLLVTGILSGCNSTPPPKETQTNKDAKDNLGLTSKKSFNNGD